jgi:hypothetical protein
MLTKGEQRMVDDILENFNFQRCHNVMKHLKWSWALTGVPSIEELKESSIERLERAIEYVKTKEVKDSCYVSSGGIKATAYKNRYNRIVMLHLEFVLTEWNSDGD